MQNRLTRGSARCLAVLGAAVLAGALLRHAGAQNPPAGGSVNAPANSYGQWKNGPSTDPGYFPIAVWLQSPSNAERYKKAGINLYVGLYRGPSEEELATLKAAGMRVVCEQNSVGLQHRDDPTIAGWMHGDEPDNAQPLPGGKGYGGPIPYTKIVDDYKRLQANDPTRPIMLNLGQGVANDRWVGRAAKVEDYPHYCEGSDIVSFDVYPVASLRKPAGAESLWFVPKGVDRLREWTKDQKRVWNCIECTHIDDPERQATPEQVRSEVWMSLIHGSRGLIYFVHQFKPRFNEHALLDDPVMLPAMTALNRQIQELAPILNSPTVANGAQVASSNAEVPVDVLVKRQGKTTYVFAAGMRNGITRAAITLPGVKTARVTVLGENRAVFVRDGKLEDAFSNFGVHLYRIAAD